MTNELHNVVATEKPHTEITDLLQQMGAAPMPNLSSLSPEGLGGLASRCSRQLMIPNQ